MVEAQIVQGLAGLLSLVVSLGVAYVAKYVKEHFHSQAVNNAVDGLGKIAQAVVADFNQRVVSDAKAQGVFTSDLAKSVKEDAIAAVKAQGSALLKLTSGSIQDVDGLVSNLIEKAVVSGKVAVPSASVTTEVQASA